MKNKEVSPSVIFFCLAIIAFLLVLWFLVNKSVAVKLNIAAADAAAQDRLYSGAVLHTSEGDITITFLQNDAPKAVYNFINLADKKFYDGISFHAVLKNFLIETGDPLSRQEDKSLYGSGGPGYTLPSEWSSEPIVRGILAMAPVGEDTASGSQFYIVTAESIPTFNGKLTAFARVAKGFDVLDKINASATENNIPRNPVTLWSVELQ